MMRMVCVPSVMCDIAARLWVFEYILSGIMIPLVARAGGFSRIKITSFLLFFTVCNRAQRDSSYIFLAYARWYFNSFRSGKRDFHIKNHVQLNVVIEY